MARDCNVNKDPAAHTQNATGAVQQRTGFDSEYANLMAELGEPAADAAKQPWDAPAMGHDITAGGTNIPPWRRPESWAQTNINNQGYRPPQSGGYGGYAGYGQQYAGYSQGGGYSAPQDYSNYAAYYQGQYAQPS